MAYLNPGDSLLVVIGPSGSGKSSVIHELMRRGLIEITPSWTTRKRRSEEVETSEHKFVSESEFDEKVKGGFFLEVVQMFGLPFRYGLPPVLKPEQGHIPLIMLRANLLPLIPKHYSNYAVYQIEDDIQKVESRLKNREAEGEAQGTRLDDYKKEVEAGRSASKRVFTNSSDIKSLADSIEAAIREDFKS